MDRDLALAGIPKRDADGCVVHVHALRHSFGTHLSMAGVAPRVAQAAMRHSNISLTMNTYTDARLLDTASAVESLPNLPLSRNVAPTIAPDADDCGLNASIPPSRTVAPTVAPTSDFSVQNESTPDNFDDLSEPTGKRKNPAIPLEIAGFIEVGLAGFEPTTSTTPR